MSAKIDFFRATGHDHGGWLVAAAAETKTALTADAAATLTAEAADVVGRRTWFHPVWYSTLC